MLNRPLNVETPNLWKSLIKARPFTRVNIETTDEAALGNAAVDLAVAADATLYFVSLTYNNKVNDGLHINIDVRHDAGPTWKWTVLKCVEAPTELGHNHLRVDLESRK
jgi:hypothetical protein